MKSDLNKKIQNIEEALKKDVISKTHFNEKVVSAMEYSLNAGGKRIRPVFLLSSCEALTGVYEDALTFAAAIEMIHTYSLIHDDLPAMDDDDYRRGKPTNHKVFGEAIAILAGDGLLNLAFESMTRECVLKTQMKYLEAMNCIAESAGINGMIGGQCADIDSGELNEETLIWIHENKTAALLSAAFKSGAIIGGANKDIACKFEEAGKLVGVAFQIQDDILDVTGNLELLGKKTCSDLKNNKLTAVDIFGLETAQEKVKLYSGKAVEILRGTNLKTDFICWLINTLVCRNV